MADVKEADHLKNAKALAKECQHIVERQEKRINKLGRGLRQLLVLVRKMREEADAKTAGN